MLQAIRKIDRLTLIKNSFLIPILLVVAMSISHVVSWYDLGNPISWAIYLSVAIEIFALASVSAASVNINRASVWFLFGLVTSIQIVGNIFFAFNDINVNGELFKSWVDMIKPLFEDWDATAHRRFLAAIQGGSLPLMSLTALHYYIKFGDKMRESSLQVVAETVEPPRIVQEAESAPVSEVKIVPESVTQDTDPEFRVQGFWNKPTDDGDDTALYSAPN